MSNENESGKHTSGPWKIVYSSIGDIEIESANERDTAGVLSRVIVARDIGGRVRGEEFDDYSEAEANASLIAASPDLLAVLEYLMRIVDSSGDERNIQIQLTPEFFEPARAAIARARGLSQ